MGASQQLLYCTSGKLSETVHRIVVGLPSLQLFSKSYELDMGYHPGVRRKLGTQKGIIHVAPGTCCESLEISGNWLRGSTRGISHLYGAGDVLQHLGNRVFATVPASRGDSPYKVSYFLPGRLEEKPVQFLIDTGCTASLLSRRVFETSRKSEKSSRR